MADRNTSLADDKGVVGFGKGDGNSFGVMFRPGFTPDPNMNYQAFVTSTGNLIVRVRQNTFDWMEEQAAKEKKA